MLSAVWHLFDVTMETKHEETMAMSCEGFCLSCNFVDFQGQAFVYIDADFMELKNDVVIALSTL